MNNIIDLLLPELRMALEAQDKIGARSICDFIIERLQSTHKHKINEFSNSMPGKRMCECGTWINYLGDDAGKEENENFK